MNLDLERLLTPEEAAQITATTSEYLRTSDCPKVRLPSRTGGKRSVLRYRLRELLDWIDQHATARRAS